MQFGLINVCSDLSPLREGNDNYGKPKFNTSRCGP